MDLDLGGRGVVGDAAVDAGVGGVGVLHQKIDARPLRFLGDDLIKTIDFPNELRGFPPIYRDSVSWSPEGDFRVAVQPLDGVWRLVGVGDDAADVDHAADVHEQVRTSDDVRGRL